MHLRREKFDVISAPDGKNGLEKAQQEIPDLILLDMILPEINGVDVCIALKDNPKTKNIPVILLTASNMRDLEKRCMTFGVAGCVTKPYEITELLQKIRQALGEAASE